MAVTSPTALPFQDAIDFFRQKLNLGTRAWTDIYGGQHARAFVVAGAARDSLLASLHGAILKALEQGTGIEEFRKDFAAIVAREGWDYKGGFGWRSKVIFDTNMRSAYAAGKWKQAQETKATRPYLRYTAVMDLVTRPLHREWHGTILPIDDAWWNTHYPPCGWNCRCSVQSLSNADLKRFGWKPSPAAPDVKMVERTLKTPDGDRVVKLPEGIDPGFEHNIGLAAWGRGAETAAMEQHGPWERLDAPGAPAYLLDPLPVDRPKAAPGRYAPKGDVDALRQQFQEAVGGDEVILTDPVGGRVLLGQAIVDHIAELDRRWDGREVYFPFLPELVEQPAEVWIGFARSAVTGRVMVRKRYIKAIELKGGVRLGLVADQDNGFWSGLTTFRGRLSATDGLRWGYRLFRREEAL